MGVISGGQNYEIAIFFQRSPCVFLCLKNITYFIFQKILRVHGTSENGFTWKRYQTRNVRRIEGREFAAAGGTLWDRDAKYPCARGRNAVRETAKYNHPPSNQFTVLWLHSDRLARAKIKKSARTPPEKCARPIQVVGGTVTNVLWA